MSGEDHSILPGATQRIRECVICKRQFIGHFHAIVCSPICKQERRRQRDGTQRVPCAVCGKLIYREHHRVTCSEKCQAEHYRRYQREFKATEALDPTRLAKINARRRQLRVEHPEIARARDKKKHHAMMSDPERAAKNRERLKANWLRTRERKLKQRRERRENGK